MQVDPSDSHCLGLSQLRAALALIENPPAVDGLSSSKRLAPIPMQNGHFR